LCRVKLYMKKSVFILSLIIFQSALTKGQDPAEKPKIVVGIIVDQMRQDYLYRYYNKYADGGFRRLMRDGFMLKNAHYNYFPTFTGPGHASVYTGTTPAIHGIISNEWYDKNLKKVVYCVGDANQKLVGAKGNGNGTVSPHRLISSTVTDELKLASQKRSKVIGISFKDRGSVLSAGHMADAAYWFDHFTGKFITSTFYMQDVPEWLIAFNKRELADQYLSQEWKTLYPIETYTESGPDDSPYESKMNGKEKPVFPYNLKELRKKNGDYDLLSYTPFANDYLTEFTKAAIDGEKLGSDEDTDFVALSYSTPDILGHAVGPNAIEIEDLYLRLDKNIADILNTLDQKFNGEYLVFLTADHGVSDVSQYLKDNRMPSGYFNSANTKARLNEFLQPYFPGKEMIETIDDGVVFFDHDLFRQDPKSGGVDMIVATELAINFLLAQDGVANAYSESMIRQSQYGESGIKGMVTRGFHPKRSGDITIVLEPGWYSATRIQGTTHGSPYSYDTNVPVIFFGKRIKKGSSVAYHPITDIAPTLSVLLNIKFPSGCTGQPIEEIFDQETK
jgi:predicted AlkP superfamily pyrophosphatase or phosphodiesterase